MAATKVCRLCLLNQLDLNFSKRTTREGGVDRKLMSKLIDRALPSKEWTERIIDLVITEIKTIPTPCRIAYLHTKFRISTTDFRTRPIPDFKMSPISS